jgi:hypothetical protein
MGVRCSIFGSGSEAKHFKHLESVWGEKYRLFSNVAFLQICTLEDLRDHDKTPPEPFKLSYFDEQRLKKTSVDFVLCEQDGKPLVALDFDGIQEGYNRGTTYVPTKGDNSWRRTIMGLKLRVAHGSGLPFFVVKSTHLHAIKSVKLTIADGLIGSALAHSDGRARLDEGFKPEFVGMTTKQFNAMSEAKKNEAVQDWVIDCDTIAMIDRNPVVKRALEMQNELGVREWSYGPYNESLHRLPSGKFHLHSGIWVTVKHPSGQTGTGRLTLTPVNMDDVDTHSVTESIAKILALIDLQKKLNEAAG